ncbi:MAG: hypothetical protein IT453_10535 [Planctomycetes bacterium]|nr:hypothetical protein [Planctomycetota bacterium]
MGTEKSDDTLTPDYSQSEAFLQKWCKGGPWVLVALAPDKKEIEVATFGQPTIARLEPWLEEQGTKLKRNIYFGTNPCGRPMKSPPSREHIAALAWLHVDLDPRAGEDHVAERARILDRLRNLPDGIPPPTCIIDSGGGYQAFWRLRDPRLLTGSADDYEDAKLYNKQLELRLGGDNCHNVDRIMRLPFTLNRPDARKRKKGRVLALASVVEFNDSQHDLAGFEKAPAVAAPSSSVGAPPGHRVEIDTANVKRFASVDDIPELRDESDGRNAKCRVCIVLGHDPDDPKKSRSEPLLFVCCQMVRAGCTDDAIYSVITDPTFGISVSVLDKGAGIHSYAERQIRKARAMAGELVLDPSDPMPSAESFVSVEAPELILYNADWLDYDGAAYREVEDGMIESRLYRFLQRAKRREMKDKKWETVPFKPNSARVSDVLRALEAVTIRPRDKFEPPCWIAEPGPPPREIISCANGLLHLPTGSLLAATPSFFTRNALEIAYDPAAPEPTDWLAFLAQLWPNDRESIDVLQEVFGYLLVPDTSQQKVFFLKGPPRSGKGTIARILRMLVGALNVSAPSLPSLGTRFGLEPLVGKSLAIVSDARDSGRMEVQAAIAENLLRISGEDLVSIDRKFKAALEARLATRFLIMSNLRPKLPDASGALANRFVPLVMTESFLGREDPALTDRLLAELPGILNWAIDGWRRLHERGYFLPSPSGRALLVEMIEDGAPVMSFVREECELDPLAQVESATLYEAYMAWRLVQGMTHVDSRVFGKDLTAAFPKVVSSRPNVGGQRVYVYTGIRLGRSDVDRAQTLLDAWAKLPGTAFAAQHEAAFDRLWGSETFYSGGAWTRP